MQNFEDKDPIYDVAQRCPVCNYEPFVAYRLKSKTQRIILDKFLVPKYEGIRGYPDSDFSCLGVTVCPSCLYSSEKETDFISLSQSSFTKKPNLPSLILKEDLLNDSSNRREILKTYNIEIKSFIRPRDKKVGFVSYLLAIECARIKIKHQKRHSFPEAGTYLLHAAQIAEEIGMGTLADQYRKNAITYFAKAYERSDFPGDHDEEVSYLNIVLNLYNDDKTTAFSYVKVIEDRRREMHAKGYGDTMKIDSFWNRIKDVLYEYEYGDELDD